MHQSGRLSIIPAMRFLAQDRVPGQAGNSPKGVRPKSHWLILADPLRFAAEVNWPLWTQAFGLPLAEELLVHEPPAFRECCDDYRVCLIDPQARDQRCPREESSVIAHRVQHGESVPLADGEILLTMPGSGMHGTRPRLERHVLTEHHGDQA